MPNMSHCQITRSTRYAREVGIINTSPNPNPSQISLMMTEIWQCKLFGNTRILLFTSQSIVGNARILSRLGHDNYDRQVLIR